MKRVVVVVKGEVQRVGYRDEVERAARKLNLTGYVENLKPYDVRIVAEGEEEKLKQFIESIRIQRFPIFVENPDVSWQDATNEFSYFAIKRGEWQEELLERLDQAGKLLYKSIELGEKNVELGEKNVKLAEKNVSLGEENLELNKRNVSLGERVVELTEKNIALGESILTTIKEESEKTRKIVEKESEKSRKELKALRTDLRVYLEENLKEIRVKISEIERALRRAGIM